MSTLVEQQIWSNGTTYKMSLFWEIINICFNVLPQLFCQQAYQNISYSYCEYMDGHVILDSFWKWMAMVEKQSSEQKKDQNKFS